MSEMIYVFLRREIRDTHHNDWSEGINNDCFDGNRILLILEADRRVAAEEASLRVLGVEFDEN